MINALNETPVGRALRLYWDDMHVWVIGNIIVIFSLTPAFMIWTMGNPEVALVASFPATFVITGIASVMQRSVLQGSPRWSALRQAPYHIAFSGWVMLLLAAGSFTLPGLVIQSLLTVIALLIAPTVICLPALYPASLITSWRNAFVIAIHFPIFALGMTCLALLFGWIVILSRGALLLALPTLWLAIMLVCLREIVQSMEVQ